MGSDLEAQVLWGQPQPIRRVDILTLRAHLTYDDKFLSHDGTWQRGDWLSSSGGGMDPVNWDRGGVKDIDPTVPATNGRAFVTGLRNQESGISPAAARGAGF